jgi:tRNA pseudouridine38-40 synthase
MARYKLILAYDGTDFLGSQRQSHSRTVQGELEKALRSMDWNAGSIILAGRTDSGVHAAGQVAAFDLDWRHTPADLLKALNSVLPSDLAINQVSETPNGFHPRFDARSRLYVYQIVQSPVRLPLLERHAWRVWPELDEEQLEENAGLFCGRHDFSTFGSPSTPKGRTVRTVQSSTWVRQVAHSGKQELTAWSYSIQADGFLYRMVRRLVFIQMAAALGKISQDQIKAALDECNELPAGLAPACGLTLVDIEYDGKDRIPDRIKKRVHP